jgi:deoxycytidylate deaminase
MALSSVLDFDYRDAEFVMAFVSPVGTDNESVKVALENGLNRFRYKLEEIRISNYLTKLILPFGLPEEPEHERINSRMDAGNAVCDVAGRNDYLALLAMSDIHKKRPVDDETKAPKPYPRKIHLLSTLKRPEEVISLRRVYGTGFLLIGLFATEQERVNYLTVDKNIPADKAKALIERDTIEIDPAGQSTRDTFYLADVFLRLKGDSYKKELWRFLDLLFGDSLQTPNVDEYAMFLAYAASLRSGDLSRQVGAVVMSEEGEIIGLGSNDVPRPGGGPYWPGKGDARDMALGVDPNQKRRDDIIIDVMRRFRDSAVSDGDLLVEGKKLFEDSAVVDVTEYARAVHAEMDAILACSRAGVSPRGGTLYCTTFPCHICTKHIISVGIKRVVYIEPYPKSRAAELHSDAIFFADHDEEKTTKSGDVKVIYEPFMGIGPRRYADLFAMIVSSGKQMVRKNKADGTVKKWERSAATPRVPMLPNSYLQRELAAIDTVEALKHKFEDGGTGNANNTEQDNT